MPKPQVDPSEFAPQDAITEEVFRLRELIKIQADDTQAFSERLKEYEGNPDALKGEMIANAILAFRHLEDAAMRLGKVLQAKNGGRSILSK